MEKSPELYLQSPRFSETIGNNLCMKNVINTATTFDSKQTLQDKRATLRKSLQEISKDININHIEDFLTVTETIIRRERERDRELYIRERKRKALEEKQKCSIEYLNKENKTPISSKMNSSPMQRNGNKSSPTFKINAYKSKKVKSSPSPRHSNSKLYFRNGRIGCVEADQNVSHVESTHALIKHILKYENEQPLVSPENVQKVLNEIENERNRKKLQKIAKRTEETKIPEKTVEGKMKDGTRLENKKTAEEIILKINKEYLGIIDNELKDLSMNIPKNDIVLLDLEGTLEGSTETSAFAPESSQSSTAPAYAQTPNEKNNGMQKLRKIQRVTEIPKSTSSDGLKNLDEDSQQFVRDQVRHLARRFTARTNNMRTRLELLLTPSSSASPPPPIIYERQLHQAQLNSTKTSSLIESSEIASPRGTIGSKLNYFEADHQSANSGALLCGGLCGTSKYEGVLDPQGKIYISWLCIVSVTFLYNAWVIPLRSAFSFQTPENTNYWFTVDFCADLIYLLDVVFFKHRVMYLIEGFWVKDKKLTRKNYMGKLQFKLDMLSLIPLDVLYTKYGTNAVYLRFPRFFKIQSFWEVFKLLDRVISSPHFVRVAKTLTYMIYMIHCTACAYYAYSAYEGLGSNRWVFNGKGHPYVRCFAFATKTATSIGKNPKPEKEGELLFMTVAWLMGVFVFALLIGQIRDIISTATRSQSEYRQLEDETLEYMRRLNLPSEIQRRVKMWFKFTWDQQRTLDESHILDSLPANLKTDIAISVHIQTLSKVQLFADCEEALLRDLVLKLRSVTFLPGDYVCRKGEVGKEMYIVKLGQVQVMGNTEVLATLSEGSVFGEISLLAINGEQGNRRTADVKSKGFSNLFVLSKNDLNEALVYYPNAQTILKRRAKSLIRKNAAREREQAHRLIKADVVIGNPLTPESQPKLLKTVMQALPQKSAAAVLLTKGSKKYKKQATTINDGDGENHMIFSKPLEYDRNKHNAQIFLSDGNTIMKCPESADLLLSTQNELIHKPINLTDSEKVLVRSASSLNSLNSDDCNVIVHTN